MNQELQIFTTESGELRMSSLEIAELLQSNHSDVKRSIKRLGARGVLELEPMAQVKNHLQQRIDIYLLNRIDSITVVAQMSPEFTKALVIRWDELERQVGTPPSIGGPTNIDRVLHALETQSATVSKSLSVLESQSVAVMQSLSVMTRVLDRMSESSSTKEDTSKKVIEPPKLVEAKPARLTALAVGKKVGLLSNDINDLLSDYGLQKYQGGRYVPTAKAKPYLAESVGNQIRWNEEIFKFLTPAKVKKYL